jgi:hypothetical protein
MEIRINNQSRQLATIYKDAVRGAMANPIVTTRPLELENGILRWWSGEPVLMLEVLYGGSQFYIFRVDPFTHRLVLDANNAIDQGLVLSLRETGESLPNAAVDVGHYVEYGPPYEYIGTSLRPGDILRVHAQVEVEDVTALNTLDVALLMTAPGQDPPIVLIATGDLQPAAAADLIDLRFDLVIRDLDTAADPANISGFGYIMTKLGATEASRVHTMAVGRIPLTGLFGITVAGDYSASAVTNLSHLKEFTVELVRYRRI